DVAAAAEEADALSDENLRIPSADRRHVDETLVVDVLHDEPDLVEMAVEHDGRRPLGVHLRHAVAGDVATNILRESRCFFPPHATGGGFITRRSWRIEQALQEGDRRLAEHCVWLGDGDVSSLALAMPRVR